MDIIENILNDYFLVFSQINLIIISVLLIALQIFSAIFILPCSYIPIICGVLFGFELGALIALICTSLSAIATFYLGFNFSDSNFVLKMKSSKLIKLVSNNIDFKIDCSYKNILIYFINPLVPGSSMGYLFGLNKGRASHFIFRTLILSIPGCILASGFGAGIIQEYFFGGASLILKILIIIFIMILVSTKLYSYYKYKHNKEDLNE